MVTVAVREIISAKINPAGAPVAPAMKASRLSAPSCRVALAARAGHLPRRQVSVLPVRPLSWFSRRGYFRKRYEQQTVDASFFPPSGIADCSPIQLIETPIRIK